MPKKKIRPKFAPKDAANGRCTTMIEITMNGVNWTSVHEGK